MKRISFSLILLISLYCLFSQQIETIETENDSLNNVEMPDSLIFKTEVDSLFTSQDSLLISLEDSLQTEIFAVDSLSADSTYIDTALLKKNLENHLAQQESLRLNLRFPFLINRENFHLRTPFEPNLQISKNGFSVIPFNTSLINQIQNLMPFYTTTYRLGFIDFSSDNYELPVAVTESFLGLGDIDMNHAFAEFKKGNLFGIENLGLDFGYLGQDGKWLGRREISANLDAHLFYKLGDYSLHAYNTTIDQKIGSNKLYPAPELPAIAEITDKLSSTSFLLENPYLNLGYRYEKASTDTLIRKSSTWLASRKIILGDHDIKASLEYIDIKADDPITILRVFHNSDLAFLNWQNSAYIQAKQNYFAASELKFKPYSKIDLILHYQKYGEDNRIPNWQQERIAAGAGWQQKELKIVVLAGSDNVNDENCSFIEAKTKAQVDWKRISILPSNWLLYRNIEDAKVPNLQSETQLQLRYNMEYDNAIIIAFDHVFVSEYGYFEDFSEGLIFNSFQNLNASLQFQITKKFKIKAEAVNVLNTEQLFGYPVSEQLEVTHFNFSLQWIFIN